MATDLTVILENQPGKLADLGEALGKAGINIDGIAAYTGPSEGVVHLLVENAETTRRTLQAAGYTVRGERPVLILKIEDRPGELGKACRRIAEAGVNIELVYAASSSRIVLGVDNLEKARLVV